MNAHGRNHAAFALALGAMLLALSPTWAIAQVRSAYVIMTNAINVRNMTAEVDVALDIGATGGGPVPISFRLWNEAGQPLNQELLTVFTDQNGYASTTAITPNLFSVSGGATALVEIRYPITSPSLAVLRKESKGSPGTLAVAPTLKADGTPLSADQEFSLAIGDLGDGMALFIANVSSVTAVVDVFQGTTGVQGTGKYVNLNLQPFAIWRVVLEAADARSNIVVRSSEPIIAQLLTLNGSRVAETMLVPN